MRRIATKKLLEVCKVIVLLLENERKIGKFFKNKWKVKEFLIYSLDTTRSLGSRWALKGMVAIQVNLKENFVLIQK